MTSFKSRRSFHQRTFKFPQSTGNKYTKKEFLAIWPLMSLDRDTSPQSTPSILKIHLSLSRSETTNLNNIYKSIKNFELSTNSDMNMTWVHGPSSESN